MHRTWEPGATLSRIAPHPAVTPPRRIGGFKLKLSPEKSILKLAADKQIKLSESDFGCLSTAFFAELQRRFG